MLNYLWGFMILTGIIYAALSGTLPSVTDAALSSAKEAVALGITMVGVMSFWVGLMRIAEEAGITAAGLYRHFVDKEAMFAALVEPVLSELQKWCERTRQVDYDFLEQGDLDAMWDSGNDLGLVVEQIYSHFNEFKLLLCCSAGTKYAWFLHDIVVMEQQETLAYMEEAKKHGVPVKEVDPKELHLLMTAYTNALFEVVVHDFTKEEALHYLDTMHQFFIPGWRAILGL